MLRNVRIVPKKREALPGYWVKPENAILNVDCEDRDFSYLARQMNMNVCKAEKKTGAFKAWCGEECVQLAPIYSSKEAYALNVAENGVTIAANTPEGLSNGVKALWRALSEDNRLECSRIDDEPSVGFRGIHLCVFPENDGTKKEDTTPKALNKMLHEAAYLGYNRVFLEFWGTFPYQKHPYACWPDSLYSPSTIGEIISLCIDDLHMIPLPVQNLTSHAGWSRIASRKHVVLDQKPEMSHMWIPGGWCFATENTDTKAFLQDIVDELTEAYRKPPIFHVSTDKCFGFGSSEADRVNDADTLFIRHLNFLHDTLAECGARMMMWADMLYGALDSRFWKASPQVTDLLPRDILMNVWTHNDPGSCWPDVDFFQGKGFETVYSPFINESSIRNMILMCERKQSLGILQTTWFCPQTALPYVALSAKWQWEGVK